MAVHLENPHSTPTEAFSSEKKRDGKDWKTRGKRKIAAGVAFIALLSGVDKAVDMENTVFSSQSVSGHTISSVEAGAMKRSLINILEGRGFIAGKETPLPFEVVTYNTAVGNPSINAPQEEYVHLLFYQKVMHGYPDAPIVGIQEAGMEQVQILSKLAKEEGNFSLFFIKSRFGNGGNMLLIPKRFEVVEGESSSYAMETQVKGVFDALRDSALDLSQAVPRTLNKVKVKDRLDNDKIFTVINTHLSYFDPIQKRQAEELLEDVEKAEKDGPVIVMGDFNAHGNHENLPGDGLKKFKEQAGLTDMGPLEGPRGKPNIDAVLTKGFRSIERSYVFGLTLPGYPTPEHLSDHYAEADWMQADTNVSE